MSPSELADSRNLQDLAPAECWRLIGHQGMGRVGYVGDTHMQIVPTRYDAEQGVAFFRVGTFGELARRVHDKATSLQIDDIDAETMVGWSVLMTGTARRVNDPDTMAALWSLTRPNPWSPGPETQWIELTPTTIEGQKVSA